MKIFFILIAALFFISCTENKKGKAVQNDTITTTNNVKQADSTKTQQKSVKPATLFEIAGNYIVESSEGNCKFNLSLYYQNKQLFYKLTTNTRKLADKATIELNEKKDGYYITFENIEWSENEGALDENNEQIDKDVALPTSVQGVVAKNEITIQNTGNAMNYYVKFGECDLKFIRLVRQQ